MPHSCHLLWPPYRCQWTVAGSAEALKPQSPIRLQRHCWDQGKARGPKGMMGGLHSDCSKVATASEDAKAQLELKWALTLPPKKPICSKCHTGSLHPGGQKLAPGVSGHWPMLGGTRLVVKSGAPEKSNIVWKSFLKNKKRKRKKMSLKHSNNESYYSQQFDLSLNFWGKQQHLGICCSNCSWLKLTISFI